MSRDERLYLQDILAACEKILRYSSGMDVRRIEEDEKTFDAVLRNLQVIGEAVKRLSEETRARYPQTDWRRIAGMRDVVTHGYFGIDPDVVASVVADRIPQLRDQIATILGGKAE